MEEEISLVEIFGILKKRIPLIMLTTLIGLTVASLFTIFFIVPQYSAASQLIVLSKTDNSTGSNVQNEVNGNVLLINTYKDLIKGDLVLDTVQKKIGLENNLHLSSAEINKMITIEQSENSQMFKIVATSDNGKESADLANTTAAVFQEKAQEVLDVSKVTVTAKAQESSLPVSPNVKLNVMIGAILGLMIGVGIAFLFELLDKTIKDERFIVESAGLPLLGAVNEMNKKMLSSSTGEQLTTSLHPLHDRNGKLVIDNFRRKRSRV